MYKYVRSSRSRIRIRKRSSSRSRNKNSDRLYPIKLWTVYDEPWDEGVAEVGETWVGAVIKADLEKCQSRKTLTLQTRFTIRSTSLLTEEYVELSLIPWGQGVWVEKLHWFNWHFSENIFLIMLSKLNSKVNRQDYSPILSNCKKTS